MKLLIKRGFCLGHGIDVYPGETLDLDEQTALQIVKSGKAAIVKETASPLVAEEEKPKTRKGARHAQD